NFRIIGPLPPYSFSQMEIKRIDIREIDKAMGIMRINRGSVLPAENEIRAAYRMMLMKFHPDKNPEDHEAQKKFEGIKQAYETLMDCIQGSARPSMRGDVIVIKKVM
ncbi:MAG: J domain-containing protein, partial [Deltaproteobacteria bacterium]